MTKKTKSSKEKISEQKKDNKRIYTILDMYSEAIEDGNIIFDDIIERLEILEKHILK